ncbi:MAG: 16S rRNA (cytosine(967)-C(5))-methyltransferase RsmB [Halioglobus sp.]
MALNTRAAAAQVIAGVIRGRSMASVLPEKLSQVPEKERALLQQLSYGSLRHYYRLEAFLQQLLDKPLREKDSDIHSLLIVGLYQLDETRIADHAAVAETVEATRKLKKPWAKGLVNAVLRRFQREREELAQDLTSAQQSAHPAWLYNAIWHHYPEQAEAILTANNQQPPMVLRNNAQQGSRDDYLAQLAQHDLTATGGNLCDSAIYLETGADVAALPGFAAGRVSVQDESAQLAAALLNPQAGDAVLDACCAPGGKTCHVLEQQPALLSMTALDSDRDRLVRVQENLDRLALNAQLLTEDASTPSASLSKSSFDRILIDAPCSATGVIRRHPDVKLLRREDDIASLQEQQNAIIEGLWPLLKVGGTLLYVTCSIMPQENSGVVARFLAAHEDAVEDVIDANWGFAQAHGRQLLPDATAGDGLYYARLKKVG